MGVYIYDKKVSGMSEKKSEALSEATAGYPSSQVARLIQERADKATDREEIRTPVDLQDIVEKLNTAIKDCRMKNNLALDSLSPEHGNLARK